MSDLSNLFPDYDPMSGRPGISDEAMQRKYPGPRAPAPRRPFGGLFPGAAAKLDVPWPEEISRTEVAEAIQLVSQARALNKAIETENERIDFLGLCSRAAQGGNDYVDSAMYTQLTWGAFAPAEKTERVNAAIRETREKISELENKRKALEQEISARTRRIQPALTAAVRQVEDRLEVHLAEAEQDSLLLDEINRTVSSLSLDVRPGFSFFRPDGWSEPSEFQRERARRHANARK